MARELIVFKGEQLRMLSFSSMAALKGRGKFILIKVIM